MLIHLQNSKQIDRLYRFYRGEQDVLNRVKVVRPEINNPVVENRAFEVVEFKKGYEFSHPIQYTNAGQNDLAPIDVLNAYARLDAKESKDLELAEWEYVAGHGIPLVFAAVRGWTRRCTVRVGGVRPSKHLCCVHQRCA